MKRIVLLITISAACVAFWLMWNRIPQVEEIATTQTVEGPPDKEELTIEEPTLIDSSYDEVIAEAKTAGLSNDQLQNVRSNAGKIALLASIMDYPIEFYGKVVDLEGNPISDAEVTYSAFNRFFENSKAQITVSDSEGYFAINDIKGGSIYVRVAKEGYYQINESKRSFGYAVPDDNPAADNPNNPAIFKLRKHGEAEPLIRYKYSWSIPRDGTPVVVDLIERKPNRHSKSISNAKGSLIIRAWSPEEKRDSKGKQIPYAWKFEITALDGGFTKRNDQFDFIAPESGYTETLTFEMPEGVTDWSEWRNQVNGEFFAKLPNGNYARLFFDYGPSRSKNGDYFRIESYTNPSGSRNLEYDPSLKIDGQ